MYVFYLQLPQMLSFSKELISVGSRLSLLPSPLHCKHINYRFLDGLHHCRNVNDMDVYKTSKRRPGCGLTPSKGWGCHTKHQLQF